MPGLVLPVPWDALLSCVRAGTAASAFIYALETRLRSAVRRFSRSPAQAYLHRMTPVRHAAGIDVDHYRSGTI